MLKKFLMASAVAFVAAGAAQASVQVVVPGAQGTYTNEPASYTGPGVYGAELRRGNNASNGDWEIGVGEATSQAGLFNQRQFAWAGGTYDFSATWNASGLALTINGQTTSYANAPLLGNALRLGAKRDATVTVGTVDGFAFTESLSGNMGDGAVNYLHFFSNDNWGGDGVTFTGTVRIGNTFTGGSASQIFFQNGDFAPVPEPATWAMMIGGFGLVGGAMRRRAKTSVAFA